MKTPIFLHYPKCAGTSISRKMISVFFSNREEANKSILCIYDSFQNPVFHLLVENINYTNLKNACSDIQNNYYLPLDDFATLLKWQSKLKIHSIYVTPLGVKFFGNNFLQIFLQNYTTIDPLYFMSIRDPWEREKSFFFYLKSNASKHEITHQHYRDISFEDYVEKKMPDSWLATTLLEKDSVDLTCNDVNIISDITEKIIFFNTDQIGESLLSIYKECGLDLDRNIIEDIFFKKNHAGEMTPERANLNSSTPIFSIFKQKKDIEYKLYDILKHRNLNQTV